MPTKSYRVTWEIDVDAGSPLEAAQIVARMMASHEFTPLDDVFIVRESGRPLHTSVDIDLADIEKQYTD